MAIIKQDYGEIGGSGAPELIWTNPNPYQAFSAQTLTPSSSGWVSGKDISNYDGVIVGTYEYAAQGSTRDSSLNYIPKDSSVLSGSNLSTLHTDYIETKNSYSFPRTVSFTSNGISFTAPNSNYNIPLYIWGVKGELAFS